MGYKRGGGGGGISKMFPGTVCTNFIGSNMWLPKTTSQNAYFVTYSIKKYLTVILTG